MKRTAIGVNPVAVFACFEKMKKLENENVLLELSSFSNK